MEGRMRDRGVTFVDGGIIGVAAMLPGKVRIYLSGEAAPQAASYFAAGPMQPEVLSSEVGRSSALKMCFAAYNKGLTALLAAVLATAELEGVRDTLERQSSWPPDAAQRIEQSAPKAWRFVHEMEEIAATLEGAGFPPGFHQAAAEIYSSLSAFKNTTPALEEILRTLLEQPAAE